jgi:hypothetical protein
MPEEVHRLRKMIISLAKTGTPSERVLASAVLVLGGELQILNRRLKQLEKASGLETVVKAR